MDQEMSPNTEISAEFPRIELEGETTMPITDEEQEKDENEKATESERNCDG